MTFTRLTSPRSLALSFMLGSGLILSACGGDKKPDPTEAEASQAKLNALSIDKGSVKRVINASGTVQPKETVLIGSEVSGRLISVNVDFNTKVKTGDLLAEINDETFRNRVEQLNASLASSDANIRIQEASINRAEVNLAQTRIILTRREGLYKERATSKAQLEEAERSMGVSEADLRLAKAQLDAALANREQNVANLNTAKIDLSRTRILSPIDGVVIERKVDAGQTVQSSFSSPELFRIAADLSKIEVEADIVESDVAGLNQGDPVEFTVDAYPTKKIQGQVIQVRLNPKTENNIVTYTAIIGADNQDGLLLPGMTANLQLTTDTKTNILRMSANAERFRPSPEQIAEFKKESDDKNEKTSLNEPTYVRLGVIGVPSAKVEKIRTELDEISQSMRDIINDPQQSFRRTPSLLRLAETTSFILEKSLSTDEMSAYRVQLLEESSVRQAMIWVKTNDGKMEQRPVKLGLSDGAFIEVVSGLTEDDQVVVGVSSPADRTGGQGGRPRGQGRRGAR